MQIQNQLKRLFSIHTKCIYIIGQKTSKTAPLTFYRLELYPTEIIYRCQAPNKKSHTLHYDLSTKTATQDGKPTAPQTETLIYKLIQQSSRALKQKKAKAYEIFKEAPNEF